MTRFVNILSQFVVGILLIFSQPSFAEEASADSAKVANPAPQAELPKSESNNLRKIQIIQMPAQELNFQFQSFQSKWMLNENDWQTLWKKSRNTSPAPKLPVQWKTESVLALFWEGKDGVVRIPSFTGSEIVDVDGARQMRLSFNLNSPCFGIITDASPAQFILIDHSLGDVDRIVIHTDRTKTTSCF